MPIKPAKEIIHAKGLEIFIYTDNFQDEFISLNAVLINNRQLQSVRLHLLNTLAIKQLEILDKVNKTEDLSRLK
jgi:hypothetical protein